MSGPAIKAPRSDLFNVRPDSDSVVIRMITDPQHPEFDERALDPVEENFVADILARGQHTPAIGYKSGKDEQGRDIVTLMFGRQRWKAVQEIWNRFRAEGLDLALAPSFRIYIQVPKNDAVKRELRISENMHRKPLDGLSLAREVREYLSIVGDSDDAKEHARVLFNFKSLDALRNCLALLDTTPAVQEQLAAGTLSPTGALQLSRQAPEVQDAVAGRIAEHREEGADGDDGDDDEGNDGGHEGDAAPEARRDAPASPAPEGPARTKPVSVSTVKEMIREETGQKTYAMVSLKQVEKEIDKKGRQLESAISKLEECNGNDAKTMNQAAKVAELQGFLAALRWARGESSAASSEAPSNDKASAAWDALREALVNAAWPAVLGWNDFAPLPPAYGPDVTDEARNDILREQRERRDRIEASRVLTVNGEKVAWRDTARDNSTREIIVDTATKWFTRLMDPLGSPSQLVRDFGAHGWLRDGSKIAGIQAWKTRSVFTKAKTAIKIDKVAEYVKGTPLAVTKSLEQIIREEVGGVVGRHSAALERENRFGAPWFESGCIGEDFGEDSGAREEIRDALESELDINIPDEHCVWVTVGELIDYVEKRVQAVAAAGEEALAPTDANESGSTDSEETDGEE